MGAHGPAACPYAASPQTAASVCLLDDTQIGHPSSHPKNVGYNTGPMRPAIPLQTDGVGPSGSGQMVLAAAQNSQTQTGPIFFSVEKTVETTRIIRLKRRIRRDAR